MPLRPYSTYNLNGCGPVPINGCLYGIKRLDRVKEESSLSESRHFFEPCQKGLGFGGGERERGTNKLEEPDAKIIIRQKQFSEELFGRNRTEQFSGNLYQYKI